MKNLFPLLFLALVACKEKFPSVPEDVIPMEKMKLILMDEHIADAVVETKAQYGGNEKKLTEEYHATIYANHGITREEYLKSFKFYTDHPVLLNKMYDEILGELSRREAAASKK